MITYKQVDRTYFPQYDRIPMKVQVSAYYRIEKHDRGLGALPLLRRLLSHTSKTSVPATMKA